MATRPLLLLLIVSSLYGQAALPAFHAEALSGRKVAMPGAVNGHTAVLVVGFTHASGAQCTEWAKRLDREFRNDPAPERYSVVFLEDAPRMVRGMAKSGIRSGVAKEEYDNYLIATEHEKEIKAAVQFGAPDEAYVVVLATDGTVERTFHGPVSDEDVRQIRESLR